MCFFFFFFFFCCLYFGFEFVFGVGLEWPMMGKLDGCTHTGEVYLTVPLEWQGAGSGCWLG